MYSLSQLIGEEAQTKCEYEFIKKADDICKFVTEHCTELESLDFFKFRYCIIGGEGEGGAFLFFCVLVILIKKSA